ncbi:MAG TPA: hypothetical protein VIQ77_13405 [Mucilaginibacter sp.]
MKLTRCLNKAGSFENLDIYDEVEKLRKENEALNARIQVLEKK